MIHVLFIYSFYTLYSDGHIGPSHVVCHFYEMLHHQCAILWPNLNKYLHIYLKLTVLVLHSSYICYVVFYVQWIRSG